MNLLKELLARIVRIVRHITRDQPSEQDIYASDLGVEEVKATITVSYNDEVSYSRTIHFDPDDDSLRASTTTVAHPYPVGVHKGKVLVDCASGQVVSISSI